jgi:hypothetical protein
MCVFNPRQDLLFVRHGVTDLCLPVSYCAMRGVPSNGGDLAGKANAADSAAHFPYAVIHRAGRYWRTGLR